MVELVADAYSDIARRLREIEAEKRGATAAFGVSGLGWAIWYAPPDRVPGWCRVGLTVTSGWGVCRSGDEANVSLYPTRESAQNVIDLKTRGSFKQEHMYAREFDGRCS